MNKNIVIAIIIILLVVLFAYFFMGGADEVQVENEFLNGEVENVETENDLEGENVVENVSEFREIVVAGSDFSFSPNQITVTEGENIRLVFENQGQMPHDFIIEGVGISTEIITAGSSSVVEFQAPSSGTYAYYCSVGNHRGMGMEGSLIVNPAS